MVLVEWLQVQWNEIKQEPYVLLWIGVTEHVGEDVKWVRIVKNVSFCWEAVRLPDAASVVFHCEALNGIKWAIVASNAYFHPQRSTSVGEGHYRADIL